MAPHDGEGAALIADGPPEGRDEPDDKDQTHGLIVPQVGALDTQASQKFNGRHAGSDAWLVRGTQPGNFSRIARCLVIQHVVPESPYAIGVALRAEGIEVDVCQVFAGDTVPASPSDLDGLVVMGGPMAAYSDDGFPTRRAEVDLIAAAVDASIPTLGVCLGAQLLAVATGGAAFAGQAGPEIGWAPVTLSQAADTDALLAGLRSPLTVLHWHGDTYNTPPGSTVLAGSRLYQHQAFRVGNAAWGLQFHLEVDHEAVEAFLTAFADEAGAAAAGPDSIRAEAPGALAALAPHRTTVLSRFASLVASQAVRPHANAST